jgi:hypothetical protein
MGFACLLLILSFIGFMVYHGTSSSFGVKEKGGLKASAGNPPKISKCYKEDKEITYPNGNQVKSQDTCELMGGTWK